MSVANSVNNANENVQTNAIMPPNLNKFFFDGTLLLSQQLLLYLSRDEIFKIVNFLQYCLINNRSNVDETYAQIWFGSSLAKKINHDNLNHVLPAFSQFLKEGKTSKEVSENCQKLFKEKFLLNGSTIQQVGFLEKFLMLLLSILRLRSIRFGDLVNPVRYGEDVLQFDDARRFSVIGEKTFDSSDEEDNKREVISGSEVMDGHGVPDGGNVVQFDDARRFSVIGEKTFDSSDEEDDKREVISGSEVMDGHGVPDNVVEDNLSTLEEDEEYDDESESMSQNVDEDNDCVVGDIVVSDLSPEEPSNEMNVAEKSNNEKINEGSKKSSKGKTPKSTVVANGSDKHKPGTSKGKKIKSSSKDRSKSCGQLAGSEQDGLKKRKVNYNAIHEVSNMLCSEYKCDKHDSNGASVLKLNSNGPDMEPPPMPSPPLFQRSSSNDNKRKGPPGGITDPSIWTMPRKKIPSTPNGSALRSKEDSLSVFKIAYFDGASNKFVEVEVNARMVNFIKNNEHVFVQSKDSVYTLNMPCNTDIETPEAFLTYLILGALDKGPEGKIFVQKGLCSNENHVDVIKKLFPKGNTGKGYQGVLRPVNFNSDEKRIKMKDWDQLYDKIRDNPGVINNNFMKQDASKVMTREEQAKQAINNAIAGQRNCFRTCDTSEFGSSTTETELDWK